MTDLPQESFSQADEEFLLAMIEGCPVDQARADEILRKYPHVSSHIEPMRADRALLAQGAVADAPLWLEAEVLARYESMSEPLQYRRLDPPSRIRLGWTPSPSQARSLAAAAALAILAGVVAIALVNRARPVPALPLLADHTDSSTHDLAREPIEIPAYAHNTEASAIELQLAELVEQHWIESHDRPEPTLTLAPALMAQGRLVIRALAVSPAVASSAAAALDLGLPSESRAWTLAGRTPPSIEAVLARPLPTGPVFALHTETLEPVEIPVPSLHASWAVRVNQDPTAIASVVHALRGQGLLVRLEESAEPVDLVSLDGAIWWDAPPSTWAPSAMVPIVVEAISR